MTDSKCKDCGEALSDDAVLHSDDHPNTCCWCFDYANGMPKYLINEERKEQGLKEFPMNDKDTLEALNELTRFSEELGLYDDMDDK